MYIYTYIYMYTQTDTHKFISTHTYIPPLIDRHNYHSHFTHCLKCLPTHTNDLSSNLRLDTISKDF